MGYVTVTKALPVLPTKVCVSMHLMCCAVISNHIVPIVTLWPNHLQQHSESQPGVFVQLSGGMWKDFGVFQ